MDKASGNVPNVPPGPEREENHPEQGLGEMMGHAMPEPALFPILPDESEEPMIAGMMETLLPQQAPPSRPQHIGVRESNTLDHNARLEAPTPIDFDPPPLQDVRPPFVTALRPNPGLQPRVPKAQALPPLVNPTNANPIASRLQTQVSAQATEAYTPVRSSAPTPVLRSTGNVIKPPLVPMMKANLAQVPKLRMEDLPQPRSEHLPRRNVPLVEMPLEIPMPPPPAMVSHVEELPLKTETIYEAEPLLEEPLPLEPVALADIEPEAMPELEILPLLDLPLPDEMVPELNPHEGSDRRPHAGLPPLLLMPQDKPIPEVLEEIFKDQSEPEVAEEKEKTTEFERATLAADAKITQKISPIPETKTEGYVRNEFFVSEGAEDPWILPSMAASGLSPNHKKRRKVAGVKVEIWSVLTTLFIVAVLLVLGAGAIAWSMRATLAKSIEARLAKKVEQAGYFATYDGWNYDPVRGIVLNELTVFESANKIIPYAKVSNIGLNTDFYTLWKTKDFARLKKTISFKGTKLTLFDQGAQVADFKDLRGSLELNQNQIALEDLEGQLSGTLFEVEGNVSLPMGSLALPAGRPLDSPALAFQYSVKLPGGSHETTSFATSEAPLLAQSAPVILRDEVPAAAPAPEESAPMFAPRKDIVVPLPEPEPQALKKSETARTVEVIKETLSPPVIQESKPAQVQQVVGTPESSTVPDLIEIPKADVSSSEPATLPLTSPGLDGVMPGTLPSLTFLSEITKYFKIKSEGRRPLITSLIDVDLSDTTQAKIKIQGRVTGDSITLEETLLSGIPFKSVDVAYSYDHDKNLLVLPRFTLNHGKSGILDGSASFNLAENILDLSETRSNIDWVGLLTAINPDFKSTFQDLNFLDAPEIHLVKGQIPLLDPLGGTLDFSYEQSAGLEYTSAGKKLTVSQINGNFKLENGVLAFPTLKGKVFEGEADVAGNLKLSDPAYPFHGKLKLRTLAMELVAEYFDIGSESMGGLLDLDYEGSASKEIQKITGVGFVDLKNCQLYKVPVIGPIQRLLGAAIPVFGAPQPSAAAGNFIIKSGVLMTSDLTVFNDGTRVMVKGQADLFHKLTAFSAGARLEGPLGITTGLVSELIEVEGRGPLSNPQIRLKGGGLPAAFTADKVKGMLGIPDGSTEAIKAVIEEIAGDTGGVEGLIKSVSGMTARNPTVATPKTTTGEVKVENNGTATLINGIKNKNPTAIIQGLQGLQIGQ